MERLLSPSRVLLLALLVLVVALPGAAMAQDSGSGGSGNDKETLTGVFTYRIGDPRSGANPKTEYLLINDRGEETELRLDEKDTKPEGGPLALLGKRVEIEGTDAPGDAIEVQEVRQLTDDVVAGAQVESDGALTGSQPTATILCRFGDSTNVTPQQPSYFNGLMGTSKPGMDHYWRETSFNNINVTGSQVFGWFNLPLPRSSYFNANGSADLNKLKEDCTAAADANVFFPNFTNVNLAFNGELDNSAWGGPNQAVNRDGQNLLMGVTWLPEWGYENQGVTAHEMGHSFGLPHSSGPYGQTYDSRWDVMSDVWGNCNPQDPTYGCPGVHTISAHKDRLAWIPPSRKYTAAQGSNQTVTIERLENAASANYMMAQIPIGGSSTVFYTVEARHLAGYDDHLPGQAIVIHKVDTTNAPGLTPIAKVVDPDNNGDPDDAGAMWLPGETFTDAANGIELAVNSATTTGYSVTISNGGPTAPANDAFANAQQLAGTSATLTGTNVGATKETGEPSHAGNAGGKSVWYRWTPQASGTATINTNGSNFDTLLGVYTGGAVNNLPEVVSNDDDPGGGVQSRVSFEATAGTTYRIAVDGYNGAAGNVTLNLSQQIPAPPNDAFANAEPISGPPASINGTNVGATREAGEPDHLPANESSLGEHSVWYSWTAPSSGSVEINTCTSDFDTVLAVYTDSLSPVANDDDTCDSPNSVGSKVTFPATAGTTYKIAVAGFSSGSEGSFTLRLIDRTQPQVTSVTPPDNATGVAPGANVTATFSEAMQASTINTTTFKLKRQGASTNVSAAVSYASASRKATLNPSSNLALGATYVATVTSGAKDSAGNSLDQSPGTTGNQSKTWSFKVRR